MAGKEIYRSVKLTDDITTIGLSVLDQVRLMFHKVSNSDEMELEANERLSAARLRLVASLTQFFQQVGDRMIGKGEKSAVVALSSRYLPVLEEVINNKYGLGRFYEFTVQKGDLPSSVDYKFLVVIRVKEGNV